MIFYPTSKTLHEALLECFDTTEMAQGRNYFSQGRVTGCVAEWQDFQWVITATVRGSKPEPYVVYLELADFDDDLDISASCSGPVKHQCKHAAAVVFMLAQDPEKWFKPPGVVAPASSAVVAKIPPKPMVPRLSPLWANWLGGVEKEASDVPARSNQPERVDHLVYILKRYAKGVKVDFAVLQYTLGGKVGKPRAIGINTLFYNSYQASMTHPADRELALQILLAQVSFNVAECLLTGKTAEGLLRKILETGRGYWKTAAKNAVPLALGEPRIGKASWVMQSNGEQQARFEVEPSAEHVLAFEPLWYLDEKTNTCGPLDTGMPHHVAAAWLSAPPIPPDQAGIVTAELDRRPVIAGLPKPKPIEIEIIASGKPVPVLKLRAIKLKRQYWMSYRSFNEPNELDCNVATLCFDYQGMRIDYADSAISEQYKDGKLLRVQREIELEFEAMALLKREGFRRLEELHTDYQLGSHRDDLTMEDSVEWMDFVMQDLPKYRVLGWVVEIDDSFQYRLAEAEDWYTDALNLGENDWFGVELGVMLDGQKINLLPLLVKFLQTDGREMTNSALALMPDDTMFPVPLPDGRMLPFPITRARQILGVLLDLLEPNALDKRGRLKLNKLRAAEIAGDLNWRWLGSTELRQMSDRLRSFTAIHKVAPPAGLQATLRPYQQEGLDWLQFLREYELAGILADDMGLGKTVQALAHLVVEKESGRMDRPSLVVAPTSLMTNWSQEAARFAPNLRVLVLHGLDRKQHFDKINDHDLVITSYPLLPRDQAMLLEQEFHYLILDEAQFIKNPKTQYAQIACALKARHHLCLTGTPMENHLGELWSLFHFLLPGFLGDEQRFNSAFRRPIEKGKNEERRQVLVHRVRPFILRRKKEQVATELPPKTEILQNVELGEAQRDLYESVRLAMHERVREEVAKKGLSRSHIVILDALLKLRQICCHPKLLKIPAAQKVNESAKLELLMDMLPQMIDEGRRILLFSQFTSMLDIIEENLDAKKIPYVLLTGDTVDRATPVAQFQGGKVPLFLISLKAGGTGLNLTAADTVIHYDPWWNPAVESQATDRAHRIGQDKKVFVYKLLTIGTVEEKIAEMQARKRELVEGLLNAGKPENLKLSPEDLEVLFAPLA